MSDEQQDLTKQQSNEPAGSIDPTPEQTPDLQRGGGVEPGDTPPDAPQTSGLSHEEPPRTKNFPISGVGAIIGTAILVIVMIAVIVGLIVMVL